MTNLRNKMALITGSSRGLCKAIAERYAALGADIVIHYSKNEIAAEAMVSNIKAMGANVIALQADISKESEVERLFSESKRAFGKIDIVVANAGLEMEESPDSEFSEEQFDHLFSISTTGAYFTMQQAALHVEDLGRIIYVATGPTAFPVSGMSGWTGRKMTPGYLMDVLVPEMGKRGVTVNSIVPFAVDGVGVFADANKHPELRQSLMESCPMGRLGEVEDVANVAEFFAGNLSSFVSGQHLMVNGGAIH
ncbi:SDR family oxidoreductase [Muricauda oceani]|uniref:SDR family oxidoreductase n=1 Tax=Flagellimonas oceani TaxID=2698672 RepID=A0A6G7IZC7_9FLAO|nr:SDR family oxidoreductase [Allomuricauda oceani]MBW8244890.1 SDR family oxidoreductase [Allomuricauda oceani]QII43552.1 SDR family oxidoreductase [Allomuricauda oceani]